MAVTDGTAKFEKRKFADNEKLSMPASAKISVDTSDWQSGTFKELIAPCDGYYSFMVNAPSGGRLYLGEGGDFMLRVNLELQNVNFFYPIKKGDRLRAYYTGTSVGVFFTPSQSAT